jgi:hypothetical protein
MTTEDKLVEKLMNNPHSLNYFKIETLFQNEDFSIRK